MAEQTDTELMQEYADSSSESAFAQLTRRHLNLVYTVALRYAGNAHDAQDIAQAVFVVLARKIPALRRRATLTGWLYETTRLTSRHVLRTRFRQQRRDQEAFMQTALDHSATDDAWRNSRRIWKPRCPALPNANARYWHCAFTKTRPAPKPPRRWASANRPPTNALPARWRNCGNSSTGAAWCSLRR